MGRFEFTKTDIEGLYVVTPAVFGDARGWFMETYNRNDFHAAGLTLNFVQDNHSRSAAGVLRGLHFQKTRPQGKLVRVVYGEVFDVAVDIRPGSAAYGKWFGVVLSADNRKQLYVPEGMAHGFLTLSETAELLYKCSDFYDPSDESGIIWNDTDIAVKWPESRVILSEKDAALKRLAEL